MKSRILFALAALGATSLFGASYVVPTDRAFIHRADAIVVAAPLSSYTTLTADNGIETVTNFSVEEVIKGDIGDSLEIREPGGVYRDRISAIGGVPRFTDGERYVLFLMSTAGGWRVLDLGLGKFTFMVDRAGHQLLVRDAGEIFGWDPDGTPHREPRRSAPEFLEFLRTESRGGVGRIDYVAPAPPKVSGEGFIPALTPAPAATFSPTSYLMVITTPDAPGARWNVFPNAVAFFSVGTEPGAPGGGTTAITAGMASWNGDPNSNVNYTYAGADTSGKHTAGLSGPDGENTVLFERDLSAYGIAPFSCSANSYSGVVGIGGVSSASGNHVGPNGETFVTTQEGDVEMNKGVANCTLLFNNGDWNSSVTHELGHTLGFRHSDQDRSNSGACPGGTLECSSTAIMTSFVPNGLSGALQAWDQHAVAAVYPGTGGGTPPPAPAGITATAQSTTSVLVQWSASSGATSYDVLRKAPGGSFAVLTSTSATSLTDTSVSPNTAYLYEVRAVNSGGTSATTTPDLATTVIFTDDPLVPRATVIKVVHLAQLRTAVNAVRLLAGLGAASFTDPASPGVVVKAVHITELRSDLDAALQALGLNSRAGGYTNPVATGAVIKAIDFQEIRDKVK